MRLGFAPLQDLLALMVHHQPLAAAPSRTILGLLLISSSHQHHCDAQLLALSVGAKPEDWRTQGN